MEQNKTGKYFKYAIGEIILVMIGILLALQVNNWNQKSKNAQLEEQYFIRLLEDLNEDSAILEAKLNYELDIKVHATKAISILENTEAKPYNYEEALISLYQASQLSYPTASISTYTELIASGRFEIVKSDNLKTSLVRYYEGHWATGRIILLPNNYRDNLRSKMPYTIQDEIRSKCDDEYIKIRSTYEVKLPKNCNIDLPQQLAQQALELLKKDESIKSDLRVQIGNNEAQIHYMNNAKEHLNSLIDELQVEVNN